VTNIRILALSGGVGGVRLLRGLYRTLPPGTLAALINTGDDFEHLGLHISPDIDTALYTLGGLAHPEQGWGRADETWNFMRAVKAIGAETWFRLGDADLALHVERTRRLREGEGPTSITQHFRAAFGIRAEILPMSDDPVATRVITDEGELAFQDYFVRRHCVPVVRGLRFEGANSAQLSDAARAAFASPALEAIIIAPSNPWLSIDPLLAIPELRQALRSAEVPVVAVTPIIAGEAVKGPTAKIMAELGADVSPLSVAQHYGNLLDGFVIDSRDAAIADRFHISVEMTDTLMATPEASDRVARTARDLATRLVCGSRWTGIGSGG
jgi:LPPG:FO 2-phospho-L-lactate transferase